MDIKKLPLIVAGVCLLLVLSFGGYMYYSYNDVLERNIILQRTNLSLSNKLEEVKQKDLRAFKLLPYTHALLDYRLKTLPGVEVTYMDSEEKDGFAITYKSIKYQTADMNNLLTVIKYIQNNLLLNPTLFYEIDIKREKNIWVLVIDFCSVASKLVK